MNEAVSLGTSLGNAVTGGISTIETSIGSTLTSLLGNEAIMWCAGIAIGFGLVAFAVRKFLPRINH